MIKCLISTASGCDRWQMKVISMNKQQVFYIHGGESFKNHGDFLERLKTADLWHLPKDDGVVPQKKWTSTLPEVMGDEYEVIMPPMPNRQNAVFSEWSIWFERHFGYLEDGAVVIGFSLGAMFLAKYLSQNDLPFRPGAIFLLSGAYAVPDFDDSDCYDFMVKPAEVRPLLGKTDNLFVLHSKDDFVVPFEHGVALADALPEAEFITFADKNHFLIEEFPELIEKIREIAEK